MRERYRDMDRDREKWGRKERRKQGWGDGIESAGKERGRGKRKRLSVMDDEFILLRAASEGVQLRTYWL